MNRLQATPPNAPIVGGSQDPPIGSTDELRIYAVEMLDLAVLYSRHAADLAEAGDFLGLETNMRKLIAATRAAAATVRDLRGRHAGP
jgi:hypothetical protein